MIHLHLRAALGRSDAQTRAHFQHIHWHAPLFYMRKDGAWHQQMPACFIAVCIRLRGNGETPSVPREGEGLTKEVGQHLLRVLTFSSALKRKVHAEATLNESPDFRCSSDQQEVKLRVKSLLRTTSTTSGLKSERLIRSAGRALRDTTTALTRNSCRALPCGRCAPATIDAYRLARACPAAMQADPSYRSPISRSKRAAEAEARL